MRYTILCFLFLSVNVFAQSPIQLQIETRSGYEFNVFNQYANRTVISNGTPQKTELQSGFFQHLDVKLSWKKEIKSHQFSVKARSRYTYFPQLKGANLFRPELNATYTYKVNKKLSFFSKNNFSIYQTNRQANETEVVMIPASYRLLRTQLGTQIRVTKRNKVKLEVYATQKQFAADQNGQLKYQSLGISVQSKQRFKQKGKPSSYLTLSGDLNRRNYLARQMEELDEEEGEEEFELVEEVNRIWQYHTGKLTYAFQTNKRLKWKVGLAFQQRLDLLEERFGYHQLQSFVELASTFKKLELKIKTSASRRLFTELSADTNGETLLKHHYLRTSLNANYNLNDHWVLTSQLSLRKRWRNFPENTSMNFLPYTNAIISFGVKYKF